METKKVIELDIKKPPTSCEGGIAKEKLGNHFLQDTKIYNI